LGWDQELNELKSRAISSHREWTAAGKPHLGNIAEIRKKDKYCYRHKIRQKQALDKGNISGSLHTALINKKQGTFWKMWRSKFGFYKVPTFNYQWKELQT